MRNNININNQSNPYYIYAPSYSPTSAGIKALHLLCHHLNTKGYPAFLATTSEYHYKTNLDLITPIATQEIVNFHQQNKKTPIVIYPDVVKGNPLNSKCTVRYLLHYAGFLGGDSTFEKDDLIFTYTKKISQKLGIENPQILFMPICNTDIFYPPAPTSPRKGSCFYASKYKLFHGAELSDLTKNSTEITRDLPDSQTTLEVADLLRKSEYFYTYEDTSLITESILCGCPVVIIKNKFFEEPLAKYELGMEGCTFDSDPQSIKSANELIPVAQKKFFEAVENFWLQLDNFIAKTQEQSLKIISESNITLIPRRIKRVPIGRFLKKKIKNYLEKRAR